MPKKKLGQNFLIDKNIGEKIIRFSPLTSESDVIEIGAGFGVMTSILAEKCGIIYAVEKDPRIYEIMVPFFSEHKNIVFIKGDILEVDINSLAKGKKDLFVFGNIPYYISTPIITRIIDNRKHIKSAYIVMQEDLADRIVSLPGSKVYGSLSCFVQFFTKVKKLLRIKRNSFYPKPKVESCLIELKMLDEPSVRVKDAELMFNIIRKAFSQRRKKAINPLSNNKFLTLERTDWEKIFKECDIDFAARAEKLSISDYARLADTVGEVVKEK
ncbi:MAG: 16S rRNA (adenine(1518)-N(6)/adenine(1519)-N(6))-dimethyltransferase RsmA [Candidatus Omnitrophota bacterium]